MSRKESSVSLGEAKINKLMLKFSNISHIKVDESKGHRALRLFGARIKNVSPIMYVLCVLFVLKYIFL